MQLLCCIQFPLTKRLQAYLASVFIILLLLNPALVIKAEQDDNLYSLSLDELMALRVSVASNIESDSRKQPVSVSTINKKQIRLSGARTLNELLSIFIPGYFLVEDQDDTIAGFRGLVPDNNSKVMLLLNGHNLNTEWFWGPPDAILNGLDLNYIERIEVIRGPGSVTLGQGALLGVINIITAQNKNEQLSINVSAGSEGLSKFSFDLNFLNQETQFWLYASTGEYQGNPIDNRGWARLRVDQGLSVYERNHHLHRSEFTNVLSTLVYGPLEATIFKIEQNRDLYNFYRDRESVEQQISGVNLTYTNDISKDTSLTLSTGYIDDQYALFSHGDNIPTLSRLNYEAIESPFSSLVSNGPATADDQVTPGLVMGGTREVRQHIKALFKHQFSPNNKIAFGFEYDYFKSGLQNSRGNNFIINEEIQLLGIRSDEMGSVLIDGNVNANNAWVKPASYAIKSFFIEDFWIVNERFDLFTAMRWDDHPNWGSQFSPRIALLYKYNKHHQFRTSWQTGFRGAVGVQFSGGFVQDGFLAQSNFATVNSIADTLVDFNFDGIANNDTGQLSNVEPETIESFELAYSYLTENLTFNNVLFYNTVDDILTAQAHGYEGLAFGDSIGTDDVGTWNGNWYYQNQEGKLTQWGLETELKYQVNEWTFSTSHALVNILDADPGTVGFYVLEDERTAVYPENITRFQLEYETNNAIGDFTFSLNDVYYWEFFSPTGNTIDGTHIINFGISYQPTKLPGLQTTLIIKNLLDSDELYPISGTGDLLGAEGVPTIEERGWWLELKYDFN